MVVRGIAEMGKRRAISSDELVVEGETERAGKEGQLE